MSYYNNVHNYFHSLFMLIVKHKIMYETILKDSKKKLLNFIKCLITLE